MPGRPRKDQGADWLSPCRREWQPIAVLATRQRTNRLGNHLKQLIDLERFGQDGDVQGDEQVGEGDREIARVASHEQVAVARRQLLVCRHRAQHPRATELGHLEIEEDHQWLRGGAHDVEGLDAILSLEHDIPLRFEGDGHQTPKVAVVIHHQYGRHDPPSYPRWPERSGSVGGAIAWWRARMDAHRRAKGQAIGVIACAADCITVYHRWRSVCEGKGAARME